MATETTRQHPWHMVEPSPWPIVGTVATLTMALGGIWYMKGGPIWGFLVGVAILAATFWGWLRDVVREANSGTFHTEPVRHGLRMGMVMFIASEVMFFFAFFWAFFHASMPILSKVAQESWPPPGIEPLATWTLPFLNTLILLTSGVTVTYAHHAIRAGLRKEFIRGLAVTIVLGFLFLGLQAFEYSHAAFGFTDGIYSSTFYLATGFHGFHVFVGACFLAVCYFRARAGHFSPDQHVGFEAAAWYWHFVDVVWVFLFVWIYWWGSAGYTPGA